MEIALGNGDIELAPITHKGRHGLLLKKHDVKSVVGTVNYRIEVEYEKEKGDVIIWVDNLESGCILQNELSLVIARMLGYVSTGYPYLKPAAGA